MCGGQRATGRATKADKGGGTSQAAVRDLEAKDANPEKGSTMHTVIRRYQGASALFDELATRERDIHDIITTVPGFLVYALVRSGDGGWSMTMCETKEGTDESSRRAAQWISENISASMPGTKPEVMEGEVMFRWSSAALPASV